MNTLYPNIETDTVEFKLITKDKLPDALWETISGFSNLDGGTIYLGIDEKGVVHGIEHQYLDTLQQSIYSICKSLFNVEIIPDVKVTKDSIIQIYIPPAPTYHRPVYSKKRGIPQGARIRAGTTNAQLTDDHIRRFALANEGGAELKVLDSSIEESIDNTKVLDYIKVVNKKRYNIYQDFTPNQILAKMQVIKDNKPTLLGLLVFSQQESLQEIGSPTFNIAVTQYRGVSKVSQNIEEVSLDDREFNGTVLEQFDNALKFIISKLPVHSTISTELKRKEYLALPEIAIREALANSIAHRDYTNRTARIQIDIYSDRVEFANPGRSLVPIENIDNATPQSRNPLLIKFLRDYNITETRGRGIRTILNATKDSGLPMPKFENIGEIFKTTLFTSAFVQENDHNWLAQFRKRYKLKDTQLVALLELKHNPSKGLSNPEYCKLNNMEKKGDDRRARYEIAMLVDNDIIFKEGEKKYTRYYLNPKFLEE